MDQIKRGIKINEKYHDAELYSKKLEGIARITNWHETKQKYEQGNINKYQQKMVDQEMNKASNELKIARNQRLKDLYTIDSLQWEQELAQKGLAIYKNKN